MGTWVYFILVQILVITSTFTADPDLTEMGEKQAIAARRAWEEELSCQMPLPQRLYCSPLTRAIRTNILTFEGIITGDNLKTMILEVCLRANP